MLATMSAIRIKDTGRQKKLIPNSPIASRPGARLPLAPEQLLEPGGKGRRSMQVETIGLSRDVPAIFAWFVNPLSGGLRARAS